MPSQTTSWVVPAFALVAAVTALRLITLAFSSADVFVDEAQYWLWGQTLDFGYYSKPPLTAWVIRLTTELANSNSPFWIRFPAPWFHGATALILGATAARIFGRTPAIWVAVSYVTLPLVAVGNTMISTDTILAPFFALGLFFYLRLLETDRLQDALLAGAMIGIAFMAKYAGIYFLLCAVIAAIFVPSFRISPRNALAFLIAFLVMISPNIIWNLQHDLTTVNHTLDNVDWVRDSSAASGINLRSFTEFVLSQFVAVGPVIFVTLFLLIFRAKTPQARGLLLFSLPIILLVSVQALLSKAYGNWAFTAYFAGTLVAVPWLLSHARRWLWAGLSFNLTITVMLPILVVFADSVSLNGKQPLLIRYLGRDELSQQILDLADDYANTPIVASDRGVLADLFLTGQGTGQQIFAVPPVGRPMNYYEQTHPFLASNADQVLFITTAKSVECDGDPLSPLATLDTTGGAYFRKPFRAFLLGPSCYEALK